MKMERTGPVLRPNPARVFFRPFEVFSEKRALRILSRVMMLSEAEARRRADEVVEEFHERHSRLRDFFLHRFEQVEEHLITDRPTSEARKILVGAYFSQEYSLEAAALFNPSIVPHPDQRGLPEGALRFVLSLRATGEGHISSITFRTGTVDREGRIAMDPASPYATAPDAVPDMLYERALFLRKLRELGLDTRFTREVLDELEPEFQGADLRRVLNEFRVRNRYQSTEERQVADGILSLARANYDVQFADDVPISERVIFPSSPAERNGIEDARFVAFREDDGSTMYYATYTAYDGSVTLPQLLATPDFARFQISTLNGPQVQNKGMALFPRRIRGHYAVLSRQDQESIHLMVSDMLHFWYERTLVARPTFPWEFVQLGNCGSPIETPEGWLVLTHGVGPMRQYRIGAILLDLDDPSRVIGRLPEPLLSPIAEEREGYVPNVVYSCGGLIHAGRLILPYAMSDQCSSFATCGLDELLAELKNHHPRPA